MVQTKKTKVAGWLLLLSAGHCFAQSSGAQNSGAQSSGDEVQAIDSSSPWRWGALLQVDGNRYDGVYRDSEHDESATDIYVRRALLLLKAKWTSLSFDAVLSANSDEDFENRLIQLQLKYSGLGGGSEFKIGKVKEEIGLEALTSSRASAFVARSMLSDVGAPYFSWGVVYNQRIADWGLRWSLGRYRNEAFGASPRDSDDHLNMANTARLTWAPWHDDGASFHLGASFTDREFNIDDRLRLTHNAEVREAEIRPLSYSLGGRKWPVDQLQQRSLEAAATMGPIFIAAEQLRREVFARQETLWDGHQFRADSAQIAWAISGEQRRYNAAIATYSAPRFENDNIIWELLYRRSKFDARAQQQGTRVVVDTIGINVYFSAQWQLQLNFLDTHVDGPGARILSADPNWQDDTVVVGKAAALRVQFAW